MELEEAINKRKAIRRYKDEPIDLADLEKLIQAGLKVPSAGGIHPLRIHIIIDETQKEELCKAALNQRCVREARACLVITSDSAKMEIHCILVIQITLLNRRDPGIHSEFQGQ